MARQYILAGAGGAVYVNETGDRQYILAPGVYLNDTATASGDAAGSASITITATADVDVSATASVTVSVAGVLAATADVAGAASIVVTATGVGLPQFIDGAGTATIIVTAEATGDSIGGAAIAREFPYSLYRRKKKPQTAWLEGTKPAVIPTVKPVVVKVPKPSPPVLLQPKPQPKPRRKPTLVVQPPVIPTPVASLRLAATEEGLDRAVFQAEVFFTPVSATLSTREIGNDNIRLQGSVSGLSYDEDDIEVLAIALGVYAEELAPEVRNPRRRRRR
ncbi:MAG: hypothetical protein Q8P46_15090 [Hyphomicrobiales bacterium]|nr:hypothetical protein [Hyphomicrobiales bacterium]